MMIAIMNGTVVDPATGMQEKRDVLIWRGRIITPEEAPDTSVIRTIDAEGLLVMPGFVDLRAHLGEPGLEDRETMETALAAAARGGFCTVCASPATDPICDSRAVAEFVHNRAQQAAQVEVIPFGALSAGMKGERLADIGDMAQAGCRLVGDTDFAVASGELMRRAMEYSLSFGVRIVTFPLDRSLWGRGILREGVMSTRLGLPGTPSLAESSPLFRDLSLAAYTGARLHVARLSSKDGLDTIKHCRSRLGADATADTTPFHLMFCDEDLSGFDTMYKFLPPLGSADDMKALRRAVRDGLIDAVASDHMPRNLIDKELELDMAEPGAISLETAAAALLTLAADGWFDYMKVAQVLSTNPANILGLEGRGTLAAGAIGDVVVVDPNEEWVPVRDWFASKSKESPFAGKTLRGRVVLTVAKGRIVYDGR